MKSFTYVIADRAGIHARPAGIVVKEAKKYESSVLFRSGDREADGKKLAPLMALGIKCGDEVIVEVKFTAQSDGSLDINVNIKDNNGDSIKQGELLIVKESDLE